MKHYFPVGILSCLVGYSIIESAAAPFSTQRKWNAELWNSVSSIPVVNNSPSINEWIV